MNAEHIIIEKPEFQKLLDYTFDYLADKVEHPQPEWLTSDQVMSFLGCRPSTLQRLRNEGEIIFSQISKKHILYQRESILMYLESHIVK